MTFSTRLGGLALLAMVLPAALSAADARPGGGSGWTGLTQPKAMITARQELMEHIELLMQPIDTLTVEPVKDAAQVRTNAEVIGAMLLAVPHLFAPTTNRFDPKAAEPQTLALPAVWTSFDAFFRLAQASSRAAEAMAQATGESAMRQASLQLRASCDACHAAYLRRYEPPKTMDSDYRFDFDGALAPR